MEIGLNPPSRSGSLLLDELRLEVDDGMESDRFRVLRVSSSPLRFERLEPDISKFDGLLPSAERKLMSYARSSVVTPVVRVWRPYALSPRYVTSSISMSMQRMLVSLLRVVQPLVQS